LLQCLLHCILGITICSRNRAFMVVYKQASFIITLTLQWNYPKSSMKFVVSNVENSFGRSESCWWRPDIYSPTQHIPFYRVNFMCVIVCLSWHTQSVTFIMVLLHTRTNFPAVSLNPLLAVAMMKTRQLWNGQEFLPSHRPRLRLSHSRPENFRKNEEAIEMCFVKATRLVK